MHAGATTEHLTDISIQISWLLRSLVSELSAQISLVMVDFWPWPKLSLARSHCWQTEFDGIALQVVLWHLERKTKQTKVFCPQKHEITKNVKMIHQKKGDFKDGKGLIESSSFVEM